MPSDSVVPKDDPTLLFTNAGMNQFKKIFLGLEDRGYKRAADSQKVLRVSGKHNDLEEVGRDHTHHTFFEMLGNWSFGDYYKKEAITWAWELLTDIWKMPKDKLYATVYVNDEEAYGFWKDLTTIDPSHISRYGEKDNFWEMGETGPCGPCSEIHMDMGRGSCPKDGKDGHVCGVNVDGCGRFVEIWNLVFIQYDRGPDGKLTELPSKHVDTGMGFERIVRVLQKKDSNYATDLFHPVIKAVEKISGIKYGQGQTDVSFRVVADHIRALIFTIGDGVLPSNEGRGYVIRRILRRAARHGRLLGLTEPFLYNLVPTVIDIMGQAYPDLKPRTEHIAMVIKNEEENFVSTIAVGLTKLLESAAAITPPNEKSIPGEVLFKLYDTFGFPIDLAQEIAAEQGLTLDLAGFNKALEQQKERARAARGDVSYTAAREVEYPSCIFVGYNNLEQKSKVTGIFIKELAIDQAEKGQNVDITLENTPFYGEGGGQAGDVGILENANCRIKVLNTVKTFNGSTVHQAEIISGSIKIQDEVMAMVDQAARLNTARHHTATHLLQSALRQVVGKHVQQQGSMVIPERLRFDFTNFAALDPMQIGEVEHLVNHKIMENMPVASKHTKLAQAQAEGAMALFGEKYGEDVRMISCGDFSKELCGGTHVKNTGEIGFFKIIKEEAVAAGVRRIEAIVGESAYRHIQQNELLLQEIQDRLKVNREDIIKKINVQMEQLKLMGKEKGQTFIRDIDKIIAEIIKSSSQYYNNMRVVNYYWENIETIDNLREAADRYKNIKGSGIGLFGYTNDGKATIIVTVEEDLVQKGVYKADKIVKKIAAHTGGKGGGRPQMAQVGFKDDGKIKEYLEKAIDYIVE